jgi:rare lipoprotein A (peptidoglycan hydrolase)
MSPKHRRALPALLSSLLLAGSFFWLASPAPADPIYSVWHPITAVWHPINSRTVSRAHSFTYEGIKDIKPTPTPYGALETPSKPPKGPSKTSHSFTYEKPSAKLPNKISGIATWYCRASRSRCSRSFPDVAGNQMYAAAGSELRIGKWRGRRVQVCASSRCLRVTLIDWCACKGNRIIDLYADAFSKLAPLSRGSIRVTVRW